MLRRVITSIVTFLLLTACTSSGAPASQPTRSASARATTSAYGGTIPLRVAIPRIEAFVAKERGLRFRHPVKVTLLSSKAFVAKLRSTQGKDDAREVEKTRATLAALGLIPASLDLAKAFHSALDTGTIGFYDEKTKQLYVRGSKATPGVQAVLSHELTHALTDQWFGLYRPAIAKDTQEKDLAWTTLLEGDAERTRTDFEAKLSASDRGAAEKEENSGGVPKVPQVVLELIGFPYIAGPEFVTALLLHGGLAALNSAYRHPPVSSEQVLRPARYFAGDVPRHVAVPRADGAALDKSDLGQIGLQLMLAQRIGPADAGNGAQGWGGDEYVSWKTGASRYCLRDSILMDDADATARLRTALAEWVAASGGRARIESRDSDVTTFLSCSR